MCKLFLKYYGMGGYTAAGVKIWKLRVWVKNEKEEKTGKMKIEKNSFKTTYL